jgi:hypothetical protein
MNKEPRLLVWNYTLEEKEKVDALLKELGAPPAAAIHKSQGHMTLREIIHSDAHAGGECKSDEKVILFYNIPEKGVWFLLNAFKQTDLPRPIYAVVTEHSIEWPFSELLGHLVEEREKTEKGHTSPNT